MAEERARSWLLLIYRVPQHPPGRRTYVWRQLKQLGAVYLQQAAAILPDTPAIRGALEALGDRIREFGGEVSLLTTRSPTTEWEGGLIGRFNQARDEEYAEIVENVERFEDEVRRESGKGKFTFAELEDLEADWEKIERWLARVQARDFYGATGAATTAEAITRGKHALELFTARVYAEQACAPPPHDPPTTPG